MLSRFFSSMGGSSIFLQSLYRLIIGLLLLVCIKAIVSGDFLFAISYAVSLLTILYMHWYVRSDEINNLRRLSEMISRDYDVEAESKREVFCLPKNSYSADEIERMKCVFWHMTSGDQILSELFSSSVKPSTGKNIVFRVFIKMLKVHTSRIVELLKAQSITPRLPSVVIESKEKLDEAKALSEELSRRELALDEREKQLDAEVSRLVAELRRADDVRLLEIQDKTAVLDKAREKLQEEQKNVGILRSAQEAMIKGIREHESQLAKETRALEREKNALSEDQFQLLQREEIFGQLKIELLGIQETIVTFLGEPKLIEWTSKDIKLPRLQKLLEEAGKVLLSETE